MTNTVSLNLVIGTYIVFITQKISKPFWNTWLSPFKHHYMNKQLFVKLLSMFLLIVYNLNFVFNRFGPMVRTWCMRYEAKHRYFKRLASFMGNFTNVPYTLAARHQNQQCYLLSGMANETFLQKQTVVGSYSTLSLIFALWPLAAVSAGRPPISWDFSTLLCWICNILFVLLVLYIIF